MTTCLTTRPAPRKQQARRKSGTLENAYRRLRSAERALRFYSANLARWLNRDPIEEGEKADNLYAFSQNRPLDRIDAIGERIVSFEVRGAQGESGWLEKYYPYEWHEVENPFKEVLKGSTLGFQSGKVSVPTCFGLGSELALGGWKFEKKILWCGKKLPAFENYVSKLMIARKRYSDDKIEVIRESWAEIYDGPSSIKLDKSESAIKERGCLPQLRRRSLMLIDLGMEG